MTVCPVCGRGVALLCSINYPRHFGDLAGETAPVCGSCRNWASKLFNGFASPKPKRERPPALCPECHHLAFKGTTPDGYYCGDLFCDWFGTLDCSCDCCDAPMESTASFVAYGIETYACDVCRNPEY